MPDSSMSHGEKSSVHGSPFRGSFGEENELNEILTKYDHELQQSDFIYHKNEQVFEKMMTGRCLPELFR